MQPRCMSAVTAFASPVLLHFHHHLSRPYLRSRPCLPRRPRRGTAPSLPPLCTLATNPSASASPPAPQASSGPLATFLQLLRVTAHLSRAEPFIAARLGLALLSILLSKVVSLCAPLLLKRAVDLLSAGGGAAAPAAALLAVRAICAHGVAKVLASAFHEGRNGVFAKGGQRLGRRVTLAAFARLLDMDAAFFGRSRTGALTRVVDRGTRSVLTLFRSVVFAFVPTAFELMLVCGVLFSRFALKYVVVVLVMFIAYCWWTARMAGVLSDVRVRMNKVDNLTASRATDSLYNSETVSIFNAQSVEVERLDESLREYEGLASKNEWIYAWQNVVQTAIYCAGLTCVLSLAALGVADGTTSVGDVVMMSQLLMQLWFPLQFFGWQYREAMQAIVDIGNLFSVLETQSSITDNPDVKLSVPRGEIVFENVTFSYPDDAPNMLSFAQEEVAGTPGGEEPGKRLSGVGRPPVLKNLSFTVPAGKAVALVGPSGSGKSSTLAALCRVYDLESGRIFIDGQDISKVSLASLRENVSIVPQTSVIWNDTVLFNLRYAKPEASFEDVVAAAKAVALHDTIMRMPLGYETVLGEKGVRMSGGEAQRLAAARALLKGSPICAFDEITSALDSKTEAEVLRSLGAIQGFKSSLTVAHRLATIVRADLIIVLINGEIVEQGTHESLLQVKGGVYADMWRRQSHGAWSPEDLKPGIDSVSSSRK